MNYKNFFGEKLYRLLVKCEVNLDIAVKKLQSSWNARKVFETLNEEIVLFFKNEKNCKSTFTIKDLIVEASNYDYLLHYNDAELISQSRVLYELGGEVICTIKGGAENRLKIYNIISLIHKNALFILPKKTPKRDDEFGTSVMTVQFSKKGGIVKVTNRYNHLVSGCDNTLNGDFSKTISPNFQKMLLAFTKSNVKMHDNILANDDVIFYYTDEYDNIYWNERCYAMNSVVYDDPSVIKCFPKGFINKSKNVVFHSEIGFSNTSSIDTKNNKILFDENGVLLAELQTNETNTAMDIVILY